MQPWSEEIYQLAADAVCRLQGAGVQEVIIAPVLCLAVLLVRMVHIEQRQVVACSSQASSGRALKHTLSNILR